MTFKPNKSIYLSIVNEDSDICDRFRDVQNDMSMILHPEKFGKYRICGTCLKVFLRYIFRLY